MSILPGNFSLSIQQRLENLLSFQASPQKTLLCLRQAACWRGRLMDEATDEEQEQHAEDCLHILLSRDGAEKCIEAALPMFSGRAK